MSQTPQVGQQAEDGYFAAWQAILRWTEEGRSWSGKEKHCCFLNIPGQAFADVSSITGLDLPEDGRGVGLTDWDNDGDIDLWISGRSAPQLRFFSNNLRHESSESDGRNFISVRLVGTKSNRDGVGARVSILTDDDDGHELRKSLRAGEGFLSQRSKWLHFGLGASKGSAKVTVEWPNGESQEFGGLEVNRHYILTQSEGNAKEWNRPRRASKVQPALFVPSATTNAANHLLVARMPMPAVEYASRKNPRSSILEGLSSPRLVVLWASWCKPCLKELGEFAANKSRLDALGLDILALSIDAAGGDDGTGARNALRFVQRSKLPFKIGFLPSPSLNQLQAVNDQHFMAKRKLSLPSSFLITRSGELAAMYRGAVSIGRLEKDVKRMDMTENELINAAVSDLIGSRGRWEFQPKGLQPKPE